MSDYLGTLAGLIEDIEENHPRSMDLGGEEFCGSCWRPSEAFPGDRERHPWPCPTIGLVRKHKRAMYEIERIFGGYGVYPKVPDEGLPLNGPKPVTRKECEQWIEAQVNGDA